MNPLDPLYRLYPGIYRFTWRPWRIYITPCTACDLAFTYLHILTLYTVCIHIYVIIWSHVPSAQGYLHIYMNPFDHLYRLYLAFFYFHNTMYRLYPGIYIFTLTNLTLYTVCIWHLRIYWTPCTSCDRALYKVCCAIMAWSDLTTVPVCIWAFTDICENPLTLCIVCTWEFMY